MWRIPAGNLAADSLASGNGPGLWPGPASGPAPGAVPRALSTMRGSSGGDVMPAGVDGSGSGSSSDSDLSAGRGSGDTPLDQEDGHSIEKWAGVTDDGGAGVGEPLVPGADIRDASSAQQLDSAGQAETPSGNGEQAIMASRAYQLEMLEQSLRQNVIVAVSGSFFLYLCHLSHVDVIVLKKSKVF